MFIQNQGTETLSLINSEGNLTVATPGLSLVNGDSKTLSDVIWDAGPDLQFFELSDLQALQVSQFSRIISGQMTLEALRELRKSGKWKVGCQVALDAIEAQ